MAALPGAGLAQGLAVTLRTMMRRSVTQEYPSVKPELPPRSRGVIALFEENCTVCMLCARECPDWCIYIDSHKETIPAPPGGRERQRNVLDRFAIDFALCMYCGICVEVCPFDALFWSPEFEYAEPDITLLTHEKDRLREWMWTVPPPPAGDPDGEPPKEIAAAQKALSKPARPAAGARAGAAGARPPRPAGERPERPARPAGERPQRPARPAGERPERPAREGTTDPASPPPSLPQPGDAPAGRVPPEVAQAAEADAASAPPEGGPPAEPVDDRPPRPTSGGAE